MARALRIERVDGRFHATARGNERKNIFRDDTDRFHFLELLSEMPERFGVALHAYALMDNHYHPDRDAGGQLKPRHAVAGGQLRHVVQSAA